MVNASLSTVPSPAPVFYLPLFDYSNPWTQGLIQAQRVQWEALLSWQQSLTAIQQELWDEWTSRFAGGVPIDA